MKTATIETGTSGDGWNMTAAKYHMIDGAIRRKLARSQDGSDELLLDQHGIVGPRLQDEQTRLSGVAYRKERAGNPEKLRAAESAHEQAAETLATQTKLLSPKIDQLRQQLTAMEKQLKELQSKHDAAEKVVADMRLHRKLLESLLPEGLRNAIHAAERPIRDKYRQRLADANYAVSLASADSSGNDKPARIAAATAAEKQLQAEMEAELQGVATEMKDFYFDM